MSKIKILITVLSGLAFSLPAYSEKMNHDHTHKMKMSDNQSSHLKVVLLPKQQNFPKMKPVKFTLNITDRNKPVEKAEISMDLTMTEMEMPKNEIKFKEVSKGVYESEGMFTMSGSWKLVTTIRYNKKTEVVNFNVDVD